MPSRVASSLIKSLDVDGIDHGTGSRVDLGPNKVDATNEFRGYSKGFSEITIVDSAREFEDIVIR
jgi:hypothetical protein